MATPLSIPSSTTHGPDADFSSDEGSKEVLEDSDDEFTMKKRIFDSDEEEGDEHETEAMGTYSFTLVKFSLHPLSLPFSLHDFLMQSSFILHVHSSDHKIS